MNGRSTSWALALGLIAVGCVVEDGDDDTAAGDAAQDDGGSEGNGQDDAADDDDDDDDDDVGDDDDDDDEDPGDTGDTGEDDAGSDTGDDDDDTDDTGDTGEPVEDPEYAAVIQGPLAAKDPAAAQKLHDGLAAGGEEVAKMLGDFGHDAMLGSDILGAGPLDFLAIDRWDNLEGPETFYGAPEFAEAFGMLFSAQPSLELFELQPDWYQWGDLTAGDEYDPYTFVVIRGRLAGDDLEASHEAHDGLAAAGEEAASMLGDVAHVVYLGVEDEREFLAIDIWSDDQFLLDFYTNPEFAEAFGSLFEGESSLRVYGSTDWYQW